MNYKAVFICIGLLFLINLGYAQQSTGVGQKVNRNDQTTFSLEREIRFSKSYSSETIVLKIEKGTDKFELELISLINTGKLVIELYNPEGKMEGTFLVETQLNSNMGETAKGKINKSMIEPAAGDWEVKIKPDGASGYVLIKSASKL